jgi:surfactin synthase thioesterase subunit
VARNTFSAENLVRLTEPPAPAARLVCFPQAGGGAAAFRPWLGHVRDDIELIAVRLPGRERLFEQEPVGDMTLIGASIGDILTGMGGPVGLFGYCAGAFAAFEAARRMTEKDAPPALLAVCSQTAPQDNASDVLVHDLPAEQLRDFLRAKGGTEPLVIEHEEFWSIAEPAIRADYRAVETYSTGPEPRVSCDIVAFRGSRDDDVPAAGLAAWAEVTTGEFAAIEKDGGHFLLQSDAAGVLAEVERCLIQLRRDGSACRRTAGIRFA